MGTEVTESKKFTTAISQWSNEVTNLVTRDFEVCGVPFDEYSKNCAMNCMNAIYQLVKSSDKTSMQTLDTSNLREIVGQAASLKLNANANPAECYFQLRNKKVGNQYMQVVEMGIQGDGYDAILRNFGQGVKRVYPVWIVKEGDEFIYPRHRGIETTPPEWESKGLSSKTLRIVYPVMMDDGTIQYLISERDSVKTNLFAHVRNNLMNETFGICQNRYKATDQQKQQIDEMKSKIFDALRECETVDDMLKCEMAIPYISGAWLDTSEEMIVRKMRNNAIRKFTKNYNAMAKQSIMQMDETYSQVQEEISENANTEDFIVIEDDV